MAHLEQYLPQRIELGAVRRIEWDTEIVRTDSGNEVRNNRWQLPVRSWEISLPMMKRDDSDYTDLLALWNSAEGMLHTFNFHDPVDDSDATIVAVRFDTPLQLSFPTTEHVHVDTFTLIEVKGIEAS